MDITGSGTGAIAGDAGSAASAGGSSMDYGALGTGGGLIGGLTSFYQPFISQNWAANASGRAWDRAKWWAKNEASMAVKGLLKAGLNPVLAAGHGGMGGGSPSKVEYASFDSDSDVVGRAVGSAKAASSLRSQLNILRNEEVMSREGVFKLFSESAKAAADAKVAEVNRDVANATKSYMIQNAEQDALQNRSLTQNMRMNLELQRAQLTSAKALADFDASPAGQALLKASRVLGPVQSVVDMTKKGKR